MQNNFPERGRLGGIVDLKGTPARRAGAQNGPIRPMTNWKPVLRATSRIFLRSTFEDDLPERVPRAAR
jgi:hypothetical protein